MSNEISAHVGKMSHDRKKNSTNWDFLSQFT